jgi:hypothetical protein
MEKADDEEVLSDEGSKECHYLFIRLARDTGEREGEKANTPKAEEKCLWTRRWL